MNQSNLQTQSAAQPQAVRQDWLDPVDLGCQCRFASDCIEPTSCGWQCSPSKFRPSQRREDRSLLSPTQRLSLPDTQRLQTLVRAQQQCRGRQQTRSVAFVPVVGRFNYQSEALVCPQPREVRYVGPPACHVQGAGSTCGSLPTRSENGTAKIRRRTNKSRKKERNRETCKVWVQFRHESHQDPSHNKANQHLRPSGEETIHQVGSALFPDL